VLEGADTDDADRCYVALRAYRDVTTSRRNQLDGSTDVYATPVER